MLTEKNSPQEYLLTTKLLVVCGALGPLLFMLVLLIEGATRPGYDSWRQAGSVLSLGDQGWMQITNFIISGLLILCFGLGLRRTLHGGQGAVWGPLLLIAVGIGLIIAGIFVTDPALGYPPGTPPSSGFLSSFHGTIHFFFGGLVVFGGLPAACFVLARRWTSEVQWKGWPTYSVMTGLLMIAFFVAFVIAQDGGPAGLLERLSLSVGMAWIVLLALQLLKQMRSSASSSQNAAQVDTAERAK